MFPFPWLRRDSRCTQAHRTRTPNSARALPPSATDPLTSGDSSLQVGERHRAFRLVLVSPT